MKNKEKQVCKYCKAELPVGAKICPICRKKQGLKIWQIVLIVFVVCSVIGAFVGSNSNQATGEYNNSNTSNKEEIKEFSQNETVTFQDVKYTVTNVTRSSGTEFNRPKEGYEYVIVSIKIENKSNKKISYNPYYWKMENSNGQEESTVFTIVNVDTELSSGELNIGGVKEGTLAFEQPKGDNNLKLNFYNFALLENKASFKIKLNKN